MIAQPVDFEAPIEAGVDSGRPICGCDVQL